MGLDSIWVFDNEDAHHPKFDPPLRLVGGVFSCHGKYSFRGKVYSEMIEHITGSSLYQEEIPNEEIVEMSKKLSSFEMTEELWGEFRYYESQDISQFKDIVRMFKTYGDAGANLIGWW